MYDLFERQLSKSRPAFATFYTNHVAAAMHRYWAATFADAPADMDHEWKLRYVAELPAAMGTFAGIFRRLLRWVHTHPEYVVIVAGSMGQDGIAAQKSYDFLTVSDGPRFCSALGLPDGAFTLLPAMAPCVSVEVAPEFRNSFRDQLTGMSIDGTPMIRDHRTFHPLCFDEQDGTFMLYVAIDDYAGPAVANVRDRDVPFAELGLGMMAHEDGVNCTAQHTAEGMLLVYDPRRKYQNGHERPEVLVTDIVPSLLDNFDVERPGYLEGEASLSFA
jgi:hypothetical protein